MEERRRWTENKKKEKEAKEQARRAKRDKQYLAQVSKDLIRLGPDLFREPVSTQRASNIRPSSISRAGPTSLWPRGTKSDNQDFATVSQDLIRLGPDLFWQLETDEQVLNTSVRNKGKIVQRKKNTPVQLQGQSVPIETEGEEEIPATSISSRGRIIHNTRKM